MERNSKHCCGCLFLSMGNIWCLWYKMYRDTKCEIFMSHFMLTLTKFTASEKELQCIAGWHKKFLRIVLPSETLLAYNQDTRPLSQHRCLSSSFSPYNFSIKFKAKTWTFSSYFPTLQPPHHSSLSSKSFTHFVQETHQSQANTGKH